MRSQDRISNLSDGLIDAILIRMPLRDAVRTSILSPAWRYKWSTLTHLKFDRTDAPLCHIESYNNNNYGKKLVGMVDQVLLLHRGPIQRFVFSTYLKSCCMAVNRWILFLSRNDITEFILMKWAGPRYKVPSLFSCDKMTHLELRNCTMNPLALFDGFKNLRTLILSFVSFSNNGLEKLISNSPSLHKLTLRCINGCTHLKLRAPNLLDLEVQDSLVDLCFEETPVLSNVYIFLTGGYRCKSTHLLGCLPSIKRLELHNRTFQILSASAGYVPVMLASTCQLKYLKACINFGDKQEMLAALCIFRSSPFLQKVDIASFSKTEEVVFADGFWGAQADLPCFSQLQILNVTRFKGTASELKFVEFVLTNAPVLEMVKIEFGISNKADVMKIARKLLRFRRISSNAEIVIPE